MRGHAHSPSLQMKEELRKTAVFAEQDPIVRAAHSEHQSWVELRRTEFLRDQRIFRGHIVLEGNAVVTLEEDPETFWETDPGLAIPGERLVVLLEQFEGVIF